MRLRFGRPSLVKLTLFAVLVGIIFYAIDNRPRRVAPTTDAVAQVRETPRTVTTTPVPAVPEAAQIADFSDRNGPVAPDTTIFIPRAGIFSRVIEAYLDGRTWDVRQLRTNVGHLEGTAWLDHTGNVVLSGHVELSDGRPGVFANLSELRTDDVVVVTTNGEEHRYIVTEVYTTVPSDLTPLLPTATERLTLITCDSYDFFSNSYLERTIVVAERLG